MSFRARKKLNSKLGVDLPKGISIAPYHPKYSSVFNLMVLDEYDKFFYGGDRDTFNSKKKMFEVSLSPKGSGTGVIALDGEKPIGFAVSITTSRFLFVAIDPSYTGMGLGRLLLSLVIEKLNNSGIHNGIRAVTKKINVKMQGILNTIGELDSSKTTETEYLYKITASGLSEIERILYSEVIDNMPNVKGD